MNEKVLLVADDDAMDRKIISKFLGEEYEILEAVDGRHALEIIAETPVDALLLDIIMPELDGLEVLKQLAGNPDYEHLAVLVATSTKERTERAALSLGADDIVSKPYDPVVIKKRLANILAFKASRTAQPPEKATVLQSRLAELLHRDAAVAKQLRSCVTMMQASAGNPGLEREILSEISRQADRLESAAQAPSEGDVWKA